MTTSDSSNNGSGAHLLKGIHSPADIKALNEADLPQLAQEVRDTLIDVLSKTGGHLGPNLGVVELTIALHRVFDTPKDKFRLRRQPSGLRAQDVYRPARSHQHHAAIPGPERISPPHRKRTRLLRRGSCRHGACPPDWAWRWAAICAAAMNTSSCVAGDAAFTCGISYEALNNARSQTKRFIVVLNDNEWSIAKNVGAIANYLNNIVANPTYAGLHDKARRFVEAIAGKTAVHLAHKFEEGAKNLFVPSVHLRGTRPALLRTDRRSRYSAAHAHLRVSQDAGRAGPAAHPDQERQRLRTGPRQAGQISRARQIQHRDRRNRAEPDADLFGIHRQDAGEIRRLKSEDRRHHRGHAERHRARIFSGNDIPTATSTSASPRNTPRFSPAAWRRRD